MTPACALLLRLLSFPLLRLYTATEGLMVHLCTPVYNNLYFIYCFTSDGTVEHSGGKAFLFSFFPLTTICCSAIHASQRSITLLSIRLKCHSEKESNALEPQTGPNKGSNWQVNLTVQPLTSLQSLFSHNYHVAPLAQVWGDRGGE